MTLRWLASAHEAVQFLQARVTGTLQTDSRRVAPGDAFIAWPGAATDGRAHVSDAFARGAVVCLVEQAGVEPFAFSDARIAAMQDLKGCTGQIAAEWFGLPTQHLAVTAVTGTNGKTSTAWWLAEALIALSNSELEVRSGCGLVGTLGVGVPPALETTGMTTPDPVLMQRVFRQFVDAGVAYCAVEASSIGLAEHRLAGTRIRVAVFTNFTQDHLDYHGSMEAYWQAKTALFDWPGLQAAVVNVDDAHGAALHTRLEGGALDLWSISMQGPARLQARDIVFAEEGLRFTVVEGVQHAELQTLATGHYNVSNLLGVVAALRALGIPFAQAVQACTRLASVPGRMDQLVQPGKPLVAVDYAHTPDALQQALAALRPVAQARGGRLWCVFGCGGNRDAGKRPLMGAAAQQLADAVIVTSDNPRFEVPQDIIAHIVAGMPAAANVQVEQDRALAIAAAIRSAASRDVVLIAGKGHEDYQESAGVRVPFSDQEYARQALEGWGGPQQ
jgi:murE/murF fusion protein